MTTPASPDAPRDSVAAALPAVRVFATDTARPAPYRGAGAELYRWLGAGWLRLTGWTMAGDWPDLPQMVLVAAPHTSNWDGINMLAAAGYYRIKLRWMGKASLTKGLFGGMVRWAGCVPIDRSRSNDVVAEMRAAFAANAAMVLAVPPEGTRSHTTAWKSGFYHIAHGAGGAARGHAQSSHGVEVGILSQRTWCGRAAGVQRTRLRDAHDPHRRQHDAVGRL